MNINPFDILKNAQKIQEQMGAFNAKLDTVSVTGSAGGGMVEIDLNGRAEVQAVRIAPEAVEDIEMLQDLIKAAFSQARDKLKDAVQSEMGALAGGMGLPPGFPSL
ncbi:nucleoid-associated protein [Spirochaetia bacterium]|nr:nucleoid-associated protein [Spirochaetia bacterium]